MQIFLRWFTPNFSESKLQIFFVDLRPSFLQTQPANFLHWFETQFSEPNKQIFFPELRPNLVNLYCRFSSLIWDPIFTMEIPFMSMFSRDRLCIHHKIVRLFWRIQPLFVGSKISWRATEKNYLGKCHLTFWDLQKRSFKVNVCPKFW